MSASILLALGSPAWAEKMPLGYCNVADNPGGTLSDNTAGAWSSAAIYIPASTASTLAGNQITGIKFGVKLILNVESAKVWIRTSLDGENLAERTLDATTTPKLTRGWNTAEFEQPWTVPADCDGFYLGYSVLQNGYCYGLANNEVPGDNGLFVNLGDKGWENLSNTGTLYLQAEVEGDNLPKVNLGIASCTLSENYQIGKGGLTGTIRVQNLGSMKTTAFDVSILSDGRKLGTNTITEEMAPGTNKEFTLKFKPEFTTPGDYGITVKIDNVAEGEDADPADNTFNSTLNVIEGALKRVVLIEEFSTEQCKNCPAGAALLHKVLHQEEYAGRLAAVVHHSGFYTDYFTKPCDREYEWFYGGDTFAPAFMVDRYSENGASPVIGTGSLDSSVAARLEEEPNLKLEMTADFHDDDDTKLTVVVKGTNYIGDALCKDPHITLWLTEDNVKPRKQEGASGDFKHQHLTRGINSTWGEPVTFNGDTFEYTFTFDGIDPDWKKSDMTVVGAVHDKKGANFRNIEILNAAFVEYENFGVTSGVDITEITGTDSINFPVEYYTVSGVRVNADRLAPGIYIKRCGKKTEKIVVRNS